ncbi:segregation and condensation protein A [Veillonella denticariosi]|uniref:segregation and condensation protein A n=1 Tax=Veillonella denticariosi TaxID=419208 RepID=UPI002490D608|nr:segregation/condensation protein A [Veillonella denticariosi]
MGDYNYKLDVFEGPLDLLLHLIEKHKIDITDIPIVEITSQYLEYLDNWNHFDIYYSSEFLVMASTLLQIKSRMLLPKADPEPDEAEDPRDELVAKLVEFKKIKDFTALLMERTSTSSDCFSRPEEISVLGLDNVYNFELSQLYQIFYQTLKRAKEISDEEPLHEVKVEKDTYSLEDMILSLSSRIRRGESLHFRELLIAIETKSGMVTIFMAVLELLKQQVMEMRSEGEDIIFTATVGQNL